MNVLISSSLAAVLVLGLAACGKKTSDPAEDLGTALGNSIVRDFARDQYKKAKAAHEGGGDATLDCIMDTSELRKDKSREAQQLADDIDALCDVDVPARKHQKDLDEKLATVQQSRKSRDGMLEANQVLLKFACEDADKAIQEMQGKKLGVKPNAKALADRKAEVCTDKNLGVKKTAAR